MMRRLLLTTACLALLSGCHTTDHAANDFKERSQQADRLTPHPVTPMASVVHKSTPILGTLEAPSTHGDPLPPRCERTLTLRINQDMTLDEVADRIAQAMGVSVNLDSRIGAGTQQTAAARPAALPEQGFPFDGRLPTSPVAAALPPRSLIQPDLSGSCETILDQIAGRFDVAWRLRGTTLYFDKYLTRTFTIRASGTTSSLNATMNTGGGNSGASQTANIDNKNDLWADTESALKAILPQDGKFTLSKASGTVTVVASPRAMHEVADYVNQLNGIIGTTIAVEVAALYITVADNDNYGLDIRALFSAGTNGGFSAGLAGLLPTLATTPGTSNLGILSPPTGSTRTSSHFAGSQVLLNAVSSNSRLADYRTATVTGRNGVAMPVSMTTNQDIVRKITSTINDLTGQATLAATTDTINYGFTMQVLPRVVAPGTVSVFLTFVNNDLTNLVDFAIGNQGTNVQLSTIDTRSLWNEITLKSGQTLVMAGTEQDRSSTDRTGIGSPGSWALGGSDDATVQRTRLLLLVTPTIVEVPK